LSRETKIGLLVGLLFIVVFGLVLSQTAGTPEEAPAVADGSQTPKREEPRKIAAPTAKGEKGEPVRALPLIGGPLGADPLLNKDEARKDAGPKDGVFDGGLGSSPSTVTRVEPRMKTYMIQRGDLIGKIMRDMYGPNYVGMGDQVLTANHVTATTLRAGSELKLPVLEVRKDAGSWNGGGGDWGSGPIAGTGPKTGRVAAPVMPEKPRTAVAGGPKDKFGETPRKDARTPTGLSGRTYTVKRGDTLYDIAKSQLGDIRAVDAIVAMNRDKITDPKLIRPGQVLRLPAERSATAVRAGSTRTVSSAPSAGSTTTKVATAAAAMKPFKLD
jgi:nucleoid-associated protein YgaU